ncbi:MAG: hypothetical protein JWO54_960 [Candidatus Saccharibacteria bacterium]|nr:hypothetical protein [Candidatus Saccharibacteria bacterium]MDB5181197.1 hypothetical protein [Candidatus Saccharibacteria bacterium]
MNQLKRHSKKVLTAIVGGFVTLVGLILVPYPGPGWLIVFGGLAILATEFEFASRMLKYTKGKYDEWIDWLKRQNIFVKISALVLTGLVVAASVYLLNGFGIINAVLSLNQDWLVSPLFR